ncbi:hypothetical protein JXD38_02420 [candidate division WOR-3 bacterium]|nr:hypothetical protein [candidate division WOR-3 bacterium]
MVIDCVWDRLAVQMPDVGGYCIPLSEPWRFEVTIRNIGDAAAGSFSVAGGAAAWRVSGLGAGRTITLLSEPRFLPEAVAVDGFDSVEESREDNNTWSLPPGGTPTPITRSLPYCDPTPTAASSRMPTPTATGTPTGTHMRVRGWVRDSISGLPLAGARVEWTFCERTRTQRSGCDGWYEIGWAFVWPAPPECIVAMYVVSADGYVSQMREVPASEYMFENFALTPREAIYLPMLLQRLESIAPD